MTKSFVLMTAMPPTTGHWQLIQFASLLADETRVILNTQPHEPFAQERAQALRGAIAHSGLQNVQLTHYDQAIEQDPETPGFWNMWRDMLYGFGLRRGDIIVASETYGQKLAEVTGAKFYPYDIARDINPAKATPIREEPLERFTDILPEFRPYLRTTVTIFGAESTGKTTLSRQLAHELGGTWLFEYARPYLESTVNEITPDSMTAIWKGQAALQRHGRRNLLETPCLVQDTDLYSTVGYWQFPHWHDQLGDCPQVLLDNAERLRSDIYLITQSNIPFEQDPLRYGGDSREGSDEYWINVCKKYDLPYIVLESHDRAERLEEAKRAVMEVAAKKAALLAYNRGGL